MEHLICQTLRCKGNRPRQVSIQHNRGGTYTNDEAAKKTAKENNDNRAQEKKKKPSEVLGRTDFADPNTDHAQGSGRIRYGQLNPLKEKRALKPNLLSTILSVLKTAIGLVALAIACWAMASRYLPVTNHVVMLTAALSPYLMLMRTPWLWFCWS